MVAVAGGALVALCAWGAARRTSARSGPDPVVRRWLLLASAVLATGLVLAGVVDVLAPRGDHPGLVLGAALTSACVAVYQALVRWNRRRTLMSDPGDWLNGTGAALAALALAYLVLDRVPRFDDVPAVRLASLLSPVAALTVLLGTAGTVLAIAELRRDRRALALTAGTAVALVGAGAQVLALPDASAGGAGWQAVAVPTGLGVLLAILAAARPGRSVALDASPEATTWGSVVVIVAASAILLVDARTGPGPGPAASLAAAAVLVASVRVARLVRDLESLVVSREEARTDTLTGVANRRALVEAVDASSARPSGAALLVIDLDRFKDVNDQYGHGAGDRVVRAVAQRLQELTSGRGLVARLGGDEFAVVLDDPDPAKAVDLARRICRAVEDPVRVDGRTLRVSASVGVASTALSAHRDGELLRCADAAMFAAKRDGTGVSVYDQQADGRARARTALAEDLRALLGRGEDVGALVLHYQPQIGPRPGQVLGAEALVRWDHPVLGVLSPAAFLEIAEEDGLMSALTWHVLDAATLQAAAWQRAGRDIPVAVNLSASCLEHPGLVDVLRDALRRAALPADRLVVEVTETTLMREPDRALDVARKVRDLGIEVSIDDFGTGYSSLTYLHELPARELKLDRSFTRTLADEPRTRAIVSGTVDLAHRLGLRVVAEGVEDERTLRVLHELGCDRTQGYLHARPMPAAELERWLDRDLPGTAGVLPPRTGAAAP